MIYQALGYALAWLFTFSIVGAIVYLALEAAERS